MDAYPNTPFEGEVLKVEPLATTQQNVTMFPVIVRIANRDGRLRPGMNAEVEIHVGQRDSVLAIPNAALRTQRDVGSAAQVLGLDPAGIEAQLAASDSAAKARTDTAVGPDVAGGGGRPRPAPRRPPAGREHHDHPRRPDHHAAPRRHGGAGPRHLRQADERQGADRRRAGARCGRSSPAWAAGVRAAGRGPPANDFQFGGRYIVFVLRNGVPTPVNVRTGLTDLDYSEVMSGVALGDSVLILPSASMIQSQQEFKQRIGNMTGGGLPGVRQTTTTPAAGGGR